jgi:D-glycero-alpha-D-manno-heptose-7-phosphate kinase
MFCAKARSEGLPADHWRVISGMSLACASLSSWARVWLAKKRAATGISNASIDAVADTAMQAGARGLKISGAGGGGFMMFLVPPEQSVQLLDKLLA